MYTISQLCQHSGLSRSTLLYYDRIGLLSASHRNESNYRLYSDNELKRLDQILNYRQTGISLAQIKKVLDSKTNHSVLILEQRLNKLNQEISALRKQQQTIINLLQKESLSSHSRSLNKEKWVDILRATGLSDDEMSNWHAQFERSLPEAHQDFLESLGIDKEEIKAIRKRSI